MLLHINGKIEDLVMVQCIDNNSFDLHTISIKKLMLLLFD